MDVGQPAVRKRGFQDAGMQAPGLKYGRHPPGQSDPLIDLAQQQSSAIERSLDHASSDFPQFDRFIGTIWHQRLYSPTSASAAP